MNSSEFRLRDNRKGLSQVSSDNRGLSSSFPSAEDQPLTGRADLYRRRE